MHNVKHAWTELCTVKLSGPGLETNVSIFHL